jgi:hypothetical protein
MCHRGKSTPVCKGDLGDGLMLARFIEREKYRITGTPESDGYEARQ